MSCEATPLRAAAANSSENWNEIWKIEGDETWRKGALGEVYDRIVKLCPPNAEVIDIGGGVGILAARLREEKKAHPTVIEHNIAAMDAVTSKGMNERYADIEHDLLPDEKAVFIATEVLEHLSMKAVRRILMKAKESGMPCFFSVPNDRLGPEEEPQHMRKWTAMSFLRLLREYWGKAARVECLGPLLVETKAPAFILGVCGFEKKFTLSVTLPVRDEAEDLPRTLASFRAVADEMVIGVDPRSKDKTFEVAEKYADVVFYIEHPRGKTPEEDKIPETGVHFGHIRNECIERCTSDWIFMTEGHESLRSGVDVLLHLDVIPDFEATKVAYVWRTTSLERWGYPWLFRNDTRLRFKRSTHNQLEIPGGALEVRLPQVETLHFRHHENKESRNRQRKVQNRKTLLDDWTARGNLDSLYYLGNEMRDWDKDKAIARMEEFLACPPKNGSARYQTRLQLAIEYAAKEDRNKARAVLIRAAEDDWTRIEHWIWLGDLAFESEKYEQALQFYRYAGSAIGDPPFSLWWIADSAYTYIPAQRLAMAYSALGREKDALHWAKRVLELLPEDAPQEARMESEEVVRMMEEMQ